MGMSLVTTVTVLYDKYNISEVDPSLKVKDK